MESSDNEHPTSCGVNNDFLIRKMIHKSQQHNGFWIGDGRYLLIVKNRMKLMHNKLAIVTLIWITKKLSRSKNMSHLTQVTLCKK